MASYVSGTDFFLASELGQRRIYDILTQGVVPRPVFLVSSRSSTGIANLAPYSFANVISITPPILAFSTLLSMTSGAAKDTEMNLLHSKECVVHILTEELVFVNQVSAVNFDSHISEFEKAGLVTSCGRMVNAPVIAGAPLAMECRLVDVVEFGSAPGRGALMLLEVVAVHLHESDGLTPEKYRAVGRMGGTWYTRAYAGAYEEELPSARSAVGVPEVLRHCRDRLKCDEVKRLSLAPSLPGPDEARALLRRTFDEDLGRLSWETLSGWLRIGELDLACASLVVLGEEEANAV